MQGVLTLPPSINIFKIQKLTSEFGIYSKIGLLSQLCTLYFSKVLTELHTKAYHKTLIEEDCFTNFVTTGNLTKLHLLLKISHFLAHTSQLNLKGNTLSSKMFNFYKFGHHTTGFLQNYQKKKSSLTF